MNLPHRLSSAMAVNLVLLPVVGAGFSTPIQPASEVAALTQAPQLTAPDDGTALATFGPVLEWTNPTGATQVHLQVTPHNNDGPGVNIILGSPDTSFEIPPPPDWYGLLPDMSYSWRVRATDATVSVSETDSRWGPWSTRRFITPEVLSSSLTLTSPSRGSRVSGLTPVLSWTSNNPAIFYYEVQVSRDPAFGTGSFLHSALLHGGVTTPTNSYAVPSSFPLAAGSTYHWRVRPRVQGDGDPVAWSTTSTFTTPEAGAITMQLSAPVDETEVSTPQYRVTGTLGGGAISLAGESQPFASRTNSKFMVMTVNQALASIDASGRFSATAELVEGPNVIDLIATDEAGEQVTSTFTVTYVPQGRTQSLALAQETPAPTGTPTPGERAREEEAKEKAREEREKAEERAKEKAREEQEKAKEKAREEREKAKEKAKARAEQEREREKEREKKRAEVREKAREQEKPRTYTGEVTEKGTSGFSIKTREGRSVSFLVEQGTEFKQHGRGKKKPTFADLTTGMNIKVYSRGVARVDRREGPKEPAKTATPIASPSPTGTTVRAMDGRLAQTPTATASPTATATPVPTGTPAVGAPSTAARPGLVAKKVELPRVKEKHAHRLGTITALNDEEITIKDKDGKQFIGELKRQTKRLPTGATFAVGDRVLLAGVWDDDEDEDGDWVIWLMVKLGQRPATPDTSPAPSPSPTATPTATPTASPTATTP